MGKIRVDETALNDVLRAVAAQGEQLDQVISVLYGACNQLLGEEFTLGNYSETVRQQLLTYRAKLIRLRIRMDDSVLAGRRAAEALEKIDLEQLVPDSEPKCVGYTKSWSSAGMYGYKDKPLETDLMQLLTLPIKEIERC